MSLAGTAASIFGALAFASLVSHVLRQQRTIAAYREEVAELTNQIIEHRRAQIRTGIAPDYSTWPGRVVDEFSLAKQRRNQTKEPS